MLGRAALAEQAALEREHDAAEHVTALAARDLLRLRRGHVEALRRVELRERLADAEPRAGDDPDTAPLGVLRLEDLGDGRLRRRVAELADAALVRDLDLGAALLDLLRDHPDALEHVDGLEPGRDARHAVL